MIAVPKNMVDIINTDNIDYLTSNITVDVTGYMTNNISVIIPDT